MSEHKKTAELHRMVTNNHICPFGIKSKDLLERKGYKVEDHHLKDRAETDAFKEKHDVKTTPQTFIDGKRVGGYDDLRNFFDMKPAKPEGKTYTPVLCVFAVTFLMALGAVFARTGGIALESLIVLFVGFSMSVLAILKFRDMFAFTNQFVTYDLLARRWVPYAYIYPYAEVFVGLGMVAGILTIPVAITALIIGSIGAASVIKAVYIDKRDLKCACVGGNSNVPLGALSLTENLMMVGMGLYMLFFMAA